MDRATTTDEIVIGLNGSHASRAALHWAVTEAARRACSLRVVSVLTTEHDDWAQINRMQAHLVRESMQTVTARVAVHREWVAGEIAPALVSAAESAAMLVIGRHQPRVSRDIAIGFITERCLREACCPVVVVPATTQGVSVPRGPGSVAR